MKILEESIKYLEKGFSVIPVNKNNKRPFIRWEEFQRRRPTKEELNQWFLKFPDANIGIVTGKISGIAVVDFDSQEAFADAQMNDRVPFTPTVKTGKGYHLYCTYTNGVRNFQKRAGLAGIDLRAEGGYVVAPPSMHNNGAQYRWLDKMSIDDISLAPLPEWLIANDVSEKAPMKDLYKDVGEGERNSSLTRVVGGLIYNGLSFREVLAVADYVNSTYNPPMDKREVFGIVKSVFYADAKKQSDEEKIDTPITLTEFLKKDIPPIEFYISGLLPKKGKGMISADANLGKSILVQNFALCMAGGIDTFMNDFEIQPAKVLYLDLEMGESALKERFQVMLENKSIDTDNLIVKHIPALDLMNEKMVEMIGEWIEELNIDVVIFDPMSNAWSGDFLIQKEVTKLTKSLNKLIDRYSISILCIHHWKKKTKDRVVGSHLAVGSYALNAWLDNHIVLDRKLPTVVISSEKSRHRKPFLPFMAKLEDSLWFKFLHNFEKKGDDELLLRVYDAMGGGEIPRTEFVDTARKEAKCGRTTIERRIKESSVLMFEGERRNQFVVKKPTNNPTE